MSFARSVQTTRTGVNASTVRRFFALALSTLVAGVGSPMPSDLAEIGWIVVVFVALDTLTGVVAAGILREVRSRTLTTMLVSKLIQYAILLCLATGAAVMFDSWYPVRIAMGGICLIESISMIETLTKLQASGVNLGPIAPVIDRVGKYFAVSIDSAAIAKKE